MVRTRSASKTERQQNTDENDNEGAQSFSAAFAKVPVPDDILQRRAVNQDEVEGNIAAKDNEDRVE
jgi:hypothetical protein